MKRATKSAPLGGKKARGEYAALGQADDEDAEGFVGGGPAGSMDDDAKKKCCAIFWIILILVLGVGGAVAYFAMGVGKAGGGEGGLAVSEAPEPAPAVKPAATKKAEVPEAASVMKELAEVKAEEKKVGATKRRKAVRTKVKKTK